MSTLTRRGTSTGCNDDDENNKIRNDDDAGSPPSDRPRPAVGGVGGKGSRAAAAAAAGRLPNPNPNPRQEEEEGGGGGSAQYAADAAGGVSTRPAAAVSPSGGRPVGRLILAPPASASGTGGRGGPHAPPPVPTSASAPGGTRNPVGCAAYDHPERSVGDGRASQRRRRTLLGPCTAAVVNASPAPAGSDGEGRRGRAVEGKAAPAATTSANAEAAAIARLGDDESSKREQQRRKLQQQRQKQQTKRQQKQQQQQPPPPRRPAPARTRSVQNPRRGGPALIEDPDDDDGGGGGGGGGEEGGHRRPGKDSARAGSDGCHRRGTEGCKSGGPQGGGSGGGERGGGKPPGGGRGGFGTRRTLQEKLLLMFALVIVGAFGPRALRMQTRLWTSIFPYEYPTSAVSSMQTKTPASTTYTSNETTTTRIPILVARESNRDVDALKQEPDPSVSVGGGPIPSKEGNKTDDSQRICFLHIGKAGGSTLACLIETGRKSISACRTKVTNGTALSRRTTLWTHLWMRPPHPTKCDAYAAAIRSPVERMISWYFYEHPSRKGPEKDGTLSRRAYNDTVALHSCYGSADDLFARGLLPPRPRPAPAMGGRGRNTNALFPVGGRGDGTATTVDDDMTQEDCSTLAWDVVQGYRKARAHNRYNYAWYLDGVFPDITGPAKKKIYVLRNEHKWDDWKRVNAMLGDSPGTIRTPSFKLNVAKTDGTNHTVSEEGMKNLCRSLCGEIKIYSRLLALADNLGAGDVAESLEELLVTCPGNADCIDTGT